VTSRVASGRIAEVTAAPVAAAPADTLRGYLVGLGGTCREEAQRGGHEGGTAELHRLTPRDGAGVQSGRQVVEGASYPSFVSLHQQLETSFPYSTPMHLHTEQ